MALLMPLSLSTRDTARAVRKQRRMAALMKKERERERGGTRNVYSFPVMEIQQMGDSDEFAASEGLQCILRSIDRTGKKKEKKKKKKIKENADDLHDDELSTAATAFRSDKSVARENSQRQARIWEIAVSRRLYY